MAGGPQPSIAADCAPERQLEWRIPPKAYSVVTLRPGPQVRAASVLIARWKIYWKIILLEKDINFSRGFSGARIRLLKGKDAPIDRLSSSVSLSLAALV